MPIEIIYPEEKLISVKNCANIEVIVSEIIDINVTPFTYDTLLVELTQVASGSRINDGDSFSAFGIEFIFQLNPFLLNHIRCYDASAGAITTAEELDIAASIKTALELYLPDFDVEVKDIPAIPNHQIYVVCKRATLRLSPLAQNTVFGTYNINGGTALPGSPFSSIYLYQETSTQRDVKSKINFDIFEFRDYENPNVVKIASQAIAPKPAINFISTNLLAEPTTVTAAVDVSKIIAFGKDNPNIETFSTVFFAERLNAIRRLKAVANLNTDSDYWAQQQEPVFGNAAQTPFIDIYNGGLQPKFEVVVGYGNFNLFTNGQNNQYPLNLCWQGMKICKWQFAWLNYHLYDEDSGVLTSPQFNPLSFVISAGSNCRIFTIAAGLPQLEEQIVSNGGGNIADVTEITFDIHKVKPNNDSFPVTVFYRDNCECCEESENYQFAFLSSMGGFESIIAKIVPLYDFEVQSKEIEDYRNCGSWVNYQKTIARKAAKKFKARLYSADFYAPDSSGNFGTPYYDGEDFRQEFLAATQVQIILKNDDADFVNYNLYDVVISKDFKNMSKNETVDFEFTVYFSNNI